MDSIDFQLALRDAKHMTCQRPGAIGTDWLEMIFQVNGAPSFYDELGERLNAEHWYIRVYRGFGSVELGEESIGSLNYERQYGGVCRGQVHISTSEFDRIFQALLHSKRFLPVNMSVRGFTRSYSSLVWQKAGAVELPIELIAFTTVLFAEDDEGE